MHTVKEFAAFLKMILCLLETTFETQTLKHKLLVLC